jgi:hypothetical protein
VFGNVTAASFNEAMGDILRDEAGTVEIMRLVCGFISRDHRLAGVHVVVLAAVGRKLPVGIGLAGIEAVLWKPETPFHQVEGFFDPVSGRIDASIERASISQQHEGQAIAMMGGVLN